jgi:glucosamine-6-phosphate deaminase
VIQVKIVDDYAEISRFAAEEILAGWRKNPRIVLGLATGATPVGMYRELVKQYRENNLDFSGITTFNLDEYYPIAPEHPQSYRHFMQEQLFDHVNIKPEQTHIPNGAADDVEQECSRYEAALKASGGIDIQVLGIGENGHIGFNEPGTSFESGTHKVKLAESTIQANSRFFKDESQVPRYALTMGIRTIMASRKILLLASGERKAKAVAAMVQGPVTEDVPASILQRHPDVLLIADKAAAGLLNHLVK